MDNEEYGVIAEAYENGFRVVYSFDNYLPAKEIVQKFPTLLVIKFEYDGSENDGMPSTAGSAIIYAFEALLDELVDDGKSFSAYTRTGGNFREFVHYTTDEESYMRSFNQAAKDHKRYPIEIFFYRDPEWTDYTKLMEDFAEDS